MLTEKITQDLKEAMRAGDHIARDTLRMLQSMVMNESIALKKKDAGLTDEEEVVVLRRAIIGNRPELEQKEEEESAVLERYLPAQMNDEDIRAIVRRAIDESGALSTEDMGKVIGRVMGEVKGMADGAHVRMIVEQELAGLHS